MICYKVKKSYCEIINTIIVNKKKYGPNMYQDMASMENKKKTD